MIEKIKDLLTYKVQIATVEVDRKTLEDFREKQESACPRQVEIIGRFLDVFGHLGRLSFTSEDWMFGPNHPFHVDFIRDITHKEMFDAVLVAIHASGSEANIVESYSIKKLRIVGLTFIIR